jgi:hypothetical protein
MYVRVRRAQHSYTPEQGCSSDKKEWKKRKSTGIGLSVEHKQSDFPTNSELYLRR